MAEQARKLSFSAKSLIVAGVFSEMVKEKEMN